MSLTKCQLQILRMMRDEEEELVFENGSGYVGLHRVSLRTLLGLLKVAAISMDQFSRIGSFERYSINETGLELLRSVPKDGKPQ